MLALFKLARERKRGEKKRREGERKKRKGIEKTSPRREKLSLGCFLFAGRNRDESGRFLNSYSRGNFGTGSGDYFKRNVLKAAMTRSVMRI